MNSDGHSLKESWSTALNDALASFRSLLTSSNSSSWKRVATTKDGTANGLDIKGKSPIGYLPETSDVVMHRKSSKSGEIFRAILDVPADDQLADLDLWKAILNTPELRQEWDASVEASQVVEMFDPATMIVKTKFSLGWPASPRDAVVISRSFSDDTTVIDVSTSLPRSADEPVYLRPSPPYVRSHVALFAWCVQLIHPTRPSTPAEQSSSKVTDPPRIRITCLCQHDLRLVWNLVSNANVAQQLSQMMVGLVSTIRKRGDRVASLAGYGYGISMNRVAFDMGRQSTVLEYSVIPTDHDEGGHVMHGLDELHAVKEQRRLERSIECLLPTSEGWDIRISARASSEALSKLPWTVHTTRIPSTRSTTTGDDRVGIEKILFQIKHSVLPDDDSVVKIKVVIEVSGSSGIRLNGIPHTVENRQDRDPVSFSLSSQLAQDASSAIDSIHTSTSTATADSDASESTGRGRPLLFRVNSTKQRSAAAEKSILTRVRRNYIYFSSLLQEPEAKWKRNTEARGVSVTQLDSIDPTLVVYRAEATFVGVGLWDLYSAIVSPGARIHWDKQFEDALLLEDVNELTELWHYKTKPAWPVNGRDSVLLKSVYKSPTTVHVFSFSVDDAHLFPNVPPPDPNVIRTQVDLQGWAIEALSPTTTLVTLLEQSDPKGWSGKATIPQQMIANVAGIGEFVIKCGGPPITTRLSGAKASIIKYEHERGYFRLEYKASRTRTAPSTDTAGELRAESRSQSVDVSNLAEVILNDPSSPLIECEIRCDIDTWASSLDIVIDPPPLSLTCLRRHRLSTGGGGLWLTINHDAIYGENDRLLAIVRRAPLTSNNPKDKGSVLVNGKKVTVDVEELGEAEVKLLSRRKRAKPIRVPLDQPPVLRRRRTDQTDMGSTAEMLESTSSDSLGPVVKTSAPKYASPLASFFTMAYETASTTTQQAVAAWSPPAVVDGVISYSSAKLPTQYALEALAFVQGYIKGSYRDSWTLITDKGLVTHRRHCPEISPSIPVHRGEKVIESVTAEEVASAISNYDIRKRWDDRFDSAVVFEEYGTGAHTAFLVSKGGFPFRDRGFYLANISGKQQGSPQPSSTDLPDSTQAVRSNSTSGSTVIYCVSASFNPDSAAIFAPSKYNPFTLPIGRMFIDAWILETLDPYTAENYAIPSTRCTRLTAVDYAGSIPVTVNSMINASLPRSILNLEALLRGFSPLPSLRLPQAGYLATSEEASADFNNLHWTVTQDDSQHTLLATRYVSEQQIFRAYTLVTLASTSSRTQTEPNPTTPKLNKGLFLPSVPNTPERRQSDNSALSTTPSNSPRPRTQSTVITTPVGTPTNSIAVRSRSRERYRASSSLFPTAKEFKAQPVRDFVIAELVVDSKLYPDGYDVRLYSRIIEPSGTSNKTEPISLSSLTEDFTSFFDNPLPIAHLIHTITTSPLQTSGSTNDQSSRCFLRLSLPTKQYYVPTIEDPLTGETRSAPPKPAWLEALEKEKRALVAIEIRPLRGTGSRRGKMPVPVTVNGTLAEVVSESEAAKSATGIDEARAAAMSVLSRFTTEGGIDSSGAELVPRSLSAPLAVADHLYDEAQIVSRASATESAEDRKDTEANLDTEAQTHETTPSMPSTPVNDKEKFHALKSESSLNLLQLFNSYSNPFSRLTSTSPASPLSPSVSGGLSNGAAQQLSANGEVKSTTGSEASSGTGTGREIQNQGRRLRRVSSLSGTVVSVATAPRYSLSSLILVALIAFLLGSLLRSLLSPADFIYVANDIGDAPERPGLGEGKGNQGLGSIVEPGWREIRRLLEIKYIMGGWDFQVAVVRRH